MAIIYKITNNINDKVYVGVTTKTLEERMKIHIQDSKSSRCEKRALYRAFNEIGIDKFQIIYIEEIEDDKKFEREIFWIDKLKSFKDGYNETYGGAGKSYLDEELIIKMYTKFKNISLVAKKLNYDIGQVSTILKNNNIKTLTKKEASIRALSKPVNRYKLDGTYLRSYQSASQAMRENPKFLSSKISEVARGNRKTHGGYIWKFKK